ncbi:acyl-CoA dehydrogenase family protein [Pseudonocardia spinosispora]|uniref:acyl-CoA dehydrogenase family protein n=1 Tax=Pseudonocardia spinosispora TaxID=103441 RepID=UPI000424B4FF|nr:acyl-CoA dehydrogenase family protein [Pseudonocardia spinosispora]
MTTQNATHHHPPHGTNVALGTFNVPKATFVPLGSAGERAGGLGGVTAVLGEGAAGNDLSGEFPADGIAAVHAAGLLTATVAEEDGGAGLGVAGQCRVLAALGEGDPSVALIAAMTLFSHAKQANGRFWPAELYSRVLDESAVRPTLLNAVRVEPDLGSPARGGLPRTIARRTSDGWAVSGHKRFATGAEGLAYFLVWAVTDEPVPRVGTFAVPGGSPGIEVRRTWNQLGLRASGSHDVVFTDAAGHLVEATEAAAATRQDNLAVGRMALPLAAIYLGVGRAAQRYFHRFAHERVPANLGRPVATTERFAQAAGEIEVLLSGAEELLFGVAERLDRGEPVPRTRALGARVVADRQTRAAVELAVRLLGNPGLSQDNPLERHFRDIQCAGVHAPQEDVALHAIGRAVLAP